MLDKTDEIMLVWCSKSESVLYQNIIRFRFFYYEMEV